MGGHAGGSDTGPTEALPGARTALVLLLAINLFNYIDRQVLAAVVRPIEKEFFPNAASDPALKAEAQAKMGLLATAFMVSYMVASPIFGILADHVSRWLLVGIGVTLWSLASGASGLAAAFWILLLTRCFVGIGEAAYGPVAPTVISDMYPVRRRGSVLAWFYMAIPVGSALGYVLGGQIAGTSLGWRWAFYLVVPPGLLLGVLCFLMREPPRGQADATGPGTLRKANAKDYLIILRTPSWLLNTLGMTAMTFVLGGVAFWMPKYLYETKATFKLTDESLKDLREGDDTVPADVLARILPMRNEEYDSSKGFEDRLEKLLPERERNLHGEQILEASATPTLGTINTIFGGIVVLAGLGATLLGGIAGDKLLPRYSGSYFLVSGVGMLIGFPFFILTLFSPLPWAWVMIFIAVFWLFFNTGPTNTVLANVTHPSVRASAFALNILIIHALGDAISPPIIGWIGGFFGMTTAFVIVSGFIILAGILWLWGAKHLARDTERAPRSLDGT